MKIGVAVRVLRMRKSLTQDALADAAHTSKSNISNLERDAQGYSPVLLSKLAEALGVQVSEIFATAERLLANDGMTNRLLVQESIPTYAHAVELKSRADASELASRSQMEPSKREMLDRWDQLTLRQQEALLVWLRAWSTQ